MKLFIFALSFLGLTSLAHATKIVGNGGDVYALRFVTLAKDVQRFLEQSDSLKIDTKALKLAIENTKIESTEKVLKLNGVVKDAINYPEEKRIVFNRSRWDESDHAQPSLVLHEYLGIMKVDDSSYQFSANLKFPYERSSISVKGPFMVNFAAKNQYLLKAAVSIENYGTSSWHYDSNEENIRVIVEVQGERKLFVLPTTGHVISAFSDDGDIDAGLNIRILQPIVQADGSNEILDVRKEMSTYNKHVVKDYRLDFTSSKKSGLPEDAKFLGPISNEAG